MYSIDFDTNKDDLHAMPIVQNPKVFTMEKKPTALDKLMMEDKGNETKHQTSVKDVPECDYHIIINN